MYQFLSFYFTRLTQIVQVSKVYVNHVGGAGLILLDKMEECNRITMFQHVCTVKEDGTFTKEPIMRYVLYLSLLQHVANFK